jgi:hypothetical protein
MADVGRSYRHGDLSSESTGRGRAGFASEARARIAGAARIQGGISILGPLMLTASMPAGRLKQGKGQKVSHATPLILAPPAQSPPI